MQTFKRILMSVVMLLLGVMILAACGGQVQQAAEEVAPTAAAAAEEAVDEVAEPAEDVAEEVMDEKPVYQVGYIQYSSDAYYQMQADAAELVVDYINENEDFGVEMTFVISEGQPEKELAHIEDFIAQDYDAIIDFTIAAETAQRGAQLANEAGIPFFVVGSTAADGPGKVTSTVKGDFGSWAA